MSEEAAEKSSLKEKSKFREESNKKVVKVKSAQRGQERVFSATALPSLSKADLENGAEFERKCADCGNTHEVQNCFAFRRKTVDERLQILKEKGLCFNCLSPHHYSIKCILPGCSVEGHTGICKGLLSTTTNSQVMLLPSAVVNLVSNDVTITVCLLVNCGSDQSYIRKDIADSLGLRTNGPMKTMTILMHRGQSRTTKVKNVSFLLTTQDQRQRVNQSQQCALP
jgi:hypothetical protein